MIKAIIMDVDGVIVGKESSTNFPLPNISILKALRRIQEMGIPVVLCTAKFNYAIKDIIIQSNLRNPHITDNGALIIDPLDKKVIKKHIFDKILAKNLVSHLISKGFYTEVYGADEYYLQKNHISEFTEKRIKILQKEHKPVNSLSDIINEINVIKILAFTYNAKQKHDVNLLYKKFNKQINLVWSTHPAIPTQNAVFTIQGVSKEHAALEVLNYLNILPAETLGIGDTLGDWSFMSICGYGATLANGTKELKQLVKTKGEGKYIISKDSVDENGILEIFDFFSL